MWRNFLNSSPVKDLRGLYPVENLWKNPLVFPQDFRLAKIFPQKLWVFHRFFTNFSTENLEFSTDFFLLNNYLPFYLTKINVKFDKQNLTLLKPSWLGSRLTGKMNAIAKLT